MDVFKILNSILKRNMAISNSRDSFAQGQASEENTILNKILKRLKYNNYRMCYQSSVSPRLAIFLYFIREIQIISLGSLSASQIQQHPQSKELIEIYKIIDMDFFLGTQGQSLINLCISSAMLFLQLIILILMFIGSNNNIINEKFSKIITIIAITTPMYIAKFLSKNFLKFIISTETQRQQSQLIKASFIISVFLFIIVLFTQFIFVTFHNQFSLKSSKKNALSRFPKTITKQYSWIFLGTLSQFCKYYAYPQIFVCYQIFILIFALIQVQHYSVGIEYINQQMDRNLGILSLLTITFGLANISHLLDITLFRKSLLFFISFFFIFATMFYLAYKNYYYKRIIIDDNTPTETSQMIYVISYILISQSTTDKKNQTYLSSILRNHINNCSLSQCCCRVRNQIYDPSKQKFGDYSLQAHLDTVFIKHFLLLTVKNSIDEFPKSLVMKIIHCLLYLQFVGNYNQCAKYLRLFSKNQKEKVPISIKYLIFCIENEFQKSIMSKNEKKGNQKIQKVKQFDENYVILCHLILNACQSFHIFWSKMNAIAGTINNLIPKLFFEALAERTLKIMSQIQKIYDKMRKINSVSTKLQEVMFFYAKDVAHNLYLLDQIKENTRQQKLTNKRGLSKNEQIKANIFSQQAACLLVSDINTIKWSSTNSATVFGYENRSQFIKIKTNNLMPLYYSKNHDNLVQNWLKTGISKKMNCHTVLWASMQNGACFKAVIYIKVQPNLLFKTLQYFVTVELICKNEIICNEIGQIIGCDEIFSKLLKLELKLIQILRPNIQILFPLSIVNFDIFATKKKANSSRRIETNYSGYIPIKVINVLEQYKKQRDIIYNKHGLVKDTISNISEEFTTNSDLVDNLTFFIIEKMQQISTDLKGRYLTINFEIEKITLFNHKMIVFRINKGYSNAIDDYYNNMQKALAILQEFQHSRDLQRMCSPPSKIFNGFDIFLNPKKLKKIIDNNQSFPKKKTFHKLSIGCRKKRAQNMMVVISNQRVRENIKKIKQVLYRQGIISLHTYSLLTNENVNNNKEFMNEDFLEESQKSVDSKNTRKSKLKKKQSFNVINSDEEISDEETHLIAGKNKYKKTMNLDEKLSDHQKKAISFQESQASSAVMISMATKVKNLKEQLEKLNVPKTLIILNCFVIILIIFINGVNIFTTINYQINTQLKEKTFQSNLKEFKIIIGLMQSRILNLQQLIQGSLDQALQLFCHQYLETVNTNIKQFYNQVNKISQETLKKGQLSNNQSLQQFFKREYVEINKQVNNFYSEMYSQIIHSFNYTDHVSNDNVDQFKFISNIVQIVLILVLMGFSLFIANSSQNKLNEIIQLLSKIYPHERSVYFDHFDRIIQQASWIVVDGLQRQKVQNQTLRTRWSYKRISQKNVEKLKSKHKENFTAQITEQIQILKKNNRRIAYIRIAAIFIFFICCILLSMFIANNNTNQISKIELQFTEIRQSQLQIALHTLLVQKYAYNMRKQMINSPQLLQTIKQNITSYKWNKVPQFLAIYKNPFVSQDLKQFISDYSTKNQCSEHPQISQKVCLEVNAFQHGAIDSYIIIDQNIHYYKKQLDNWPKYLIDSQNISANRRFNQTSFLIINAINGKLGFILAQKILNEDSKLLSAKKSVQIIIMCSTIVLSIIFLALWRCSYLAISKKSSSSNSYLLMIPFDILIENPYIKLYIKQQIGYKSSAM